MPWPKGRAHRAERAIASEPACHLVQTTCKKHKPQHQTKDGSAEVVSRRHECAQHRRTLFANTDSSWTGLLPSPRKDQIGQFERVWTPDKRPKSPWRYHCPNTYSAGGETWTPTRPVSWTRSSQVPSTSPPSPQRIQQPPYFTITH